MTIIVMNTLNAAVTEYDWTLQSITPTHATRNDGLFTLGGETDAGSAIAADVRTGKTLWGSDRKKAVENVYYGLKGSGTGVCRIDGESTSFEYNFAIRASGVSRAEPGKGISENYLGFGFKNTAGADFRLDRIDVGVVQSKQRSM